MDLCFLLLLVRLMAENWSWSQASSFSHCSPLVAPWRRLGQFSWSFVSLLGLALQVQSLSWVGCSPMSMMILPQEDELMHFVWLWVFYHLGQEYHSDNPKATSLGPQLSPIISGFVSTVSWRWTFWVALIVAGFSFSLLVFLPETYGPTILLRRARRIRKETGNSRIIAPIEVETKGTRQMITVILMRPLRMLIFESIVLFTCLYLALAYAILCTISVAGLLCEKHTLIRIWLDLFFVAYPLIFHGQWKGSS